jgi:hypothetical protein
MEEIPSEQSGPSAKSPQRAYRVSPKNLAANRQNAARSTGPRSAAGKERSRLNALKHGLLASEAVNRLIEGEPARTAFDALAERLAGYYRPLGPVEEILVEKVAIATWRLKRILRFEAQAAYRAWREDQHDGYARLIKRLGLGEEVEKRQREHRQVFRAAGLEGVTLPNHGNGMLMMRYEAAVNRDLYRSMAELRRLRKERGEAVGAEAETDAAGGEPPSAGGGGDSGQTLAGVEREARLATEAGEAASKEEVERLADQIIEARGLSEYQRFYQTNPISPAPAASGPGAQPPEGAQTPPAGPLR